MIQQGTDGISRGDFSTGVMGGHSMFNYIPLHMSALERENKLIGWIKKWVTPQLDDKIVKFLEYDGWFEQGHDIVGGRLNEDGVWSPEYEAGTFVWTPAPAAALVAVEQLRRARSKRELSTHVFIVPRLMCPEWRRQLYRVSDLYLELPFDDTYWPKHKHHEPLIFAVVFPFLSHSPWQLKRSPAFLGMGGLLRRMWKSSKIATWIVLRKLFVQQRKLDSLPEGVVRKMLQSTSQFGVLHSQGGE
jgi:hypothetical protein